MSTFQTSVAARLTRAGRAAAAVLALAALPALAGLAGGRAVAAAPADAAPPQTVTDLAGRTVRVPAEAPRRILLGEGRLLSAVALLEGKTPFARIVGWQGDLPALDPQTYAQYARVFPQIHDIPKIGQSTEDSVSPEKALSLKPDLAILTFGGEGPGRYNALVRQLEAIGTTVVFVDFRIHPLQDTLPSIRLLGAVMHREREASAYADFYSSRLARIRAVVDRIPEAQRPKVFVDLLAGAWSGGCCHTAGNGNFGDLVAAAGGRNVAAGLVPGVLGDMSMEQLIAARPDVYVATGSHAKGNGPALRVGAETPEADGRRSLAQLVSRPGFDAIKAIHDGRAHGISHNYYDSPYNIVAVEALAKWFYPQQFRDLDVGATEAELYRRFLAVPASGTFWVDSPAG